MIQTGCICTTYATNEYLADIDTFIHILCSQEELQCTLDFLSNLHIETFGNQFAVIARPAASAISHRNRFGICALVSPLNQLYQLLKTQVGFMTEQNFVVLQHHSVHIHITDIYHQNLGTGKLVAHHFIRVDKSIGQRKHIHIHIHSLQTHFFQQIDTTIHVICLCCCDNDRQNTCPWIFRQLLPVIVHTIQCADTSHFRLNHFLQRNIVAFRIVRKIFLNGHNTAWQCNIDLLATCFQLGITLLQMRDKLVKINDVIA